MAESLQERIEWAYQQLWHQLIGQTVMRSAEPPLDSFFHPLPFTIR